MSTAGKKTKATSRKIVIVYKNVKKYNKLLSIIFIFCKTEQKASDMQKCILEAFCVMIKFE